MSAQMEPPSDLQRWLTAAVAVRVQLTALIVGANTCQQLAKPALCSTEFHAA